MKKLIPIFLLIAFVAWAAPPSGRFNNVTVDNGLTLGGERFTAWPTVGVPDNLALLRGDNGAIRGFSTIGNPDFSDNLALYGESLTGDSTGDISGFDNGTFTGRLTAPSIGSASYTDNGYLKDLITKGPYVDVRAYMDGLSGRNTLAAWEADDTIDVTAALKAGIAASVAATKSLFLPTGNFTFTDNLSIPAHSTIYALGRTSGNNSAGYSTTLTFRPSVAGPAIITEFVSSYLDSIHLSGFMLIADNTNASPTIGINFKGVLGGSLNDIGITGPFTTAGLILDGNLGVTASRINVANTNTTTAMAAGLVLKGTPWVGTTTTVNNIYIHGVAGATGGITDGIVAEGDAVLVGVLNQPIVESISRYGFNFHGGNYIYVNSPYTENIPNVNAVSPIFRIAVDSPSSAYLSITNIKGGTIGATNTGSDNVIGFQTDNVYMLNIDGVSFARVKTFINSTSTTTNSTSIRNCNDGGDLTSFGSIGRIGTLYIDGSNKFARYPSQHRSYATTDNIATNYLYPGQHFYDSSEKKSYVYNGTNWDNTPQTAVAGLDFTALAPAACEVLTITVPNITEAGYGTVTVGARTALGGIDNTILYGWVSADNTVSIRRCNVGGTTTSNPAQTSVRVKVWEN